MTQSELEQTFINQLVGMEYQLIRITNEQEMLDNLKRQLEIHNNITLTSAEFKQILNYLNTSSVFDRAKILRDKFTLKRG